MKTLALGLGCILLSACGGSGGSGLHAEVMPFGALAFDSGSVPSGSPVTFDFKASATGTVDLAAPTSKPSKGTMKVAAKIVLAGTAISTLPGASYNGPIEGAPDLSIAIDGSSALDLTTVGMPSTLTATVPASDLATIPLATALGIPAVTGNLDLKVVGGTVTEVYAPTCSQPGSYAGTVTTSGSVMIGGDVMVAVPLVGMKTIPIPAFSIPLPNNVTAVTLGKAGCGAASTDGGVVLGDGGVVLGDGGVVLGDGGIPDYVEADDGGRKLEGIAPADNAASVDGQSQPLDHAFALPQDAEWGFATKTSALFPYGTDIYFVGPQLGSDCTTGAGVVLVVFTSSDPTAEPTYYTSDQTSTCGLTVTALSTTAGDHVRATFSGTVTVATDVAADMATIPPPPGPTSYTVTATFDVIN